MADLQQSLFSKDPEPWRLDADATRMVATIVLSEGPDQEFDYLVPPAFIETDRADRVLEIGRRVLAPFGRGNRSVVGYCVRLEQRSVGSRRLKLIESVIDPQPLLTASMLRLTKWIAETYVCPLGQVLEAVVPSGVRAQAGTRKVRLLSAPPEVIARWVNGELEFTSPQQRDAMQCMAAARSPMTPAQLAERVGCSEAPIKTLISKGYLAETTGRASRFQLANHRDRPPRQNPLALNSDQKNALSMIVDGLNTAVHRCFLIHGVTGSGKTEVYIQAIEETVRFGRQAIVLVPEISLTPQTVARFEARFDGVAILHSHQTAVERHAHWRRIAAGDVQVVVGARSAIFAPTRDLGLIVIDEEHEASFKQDVAPRYHAREVALERAREEGVPVVLGSATPSLESMHKATAGAYQLISMPRRVANRPMPGVRIVDLRQQRADAPFRGAISRYLQQAMTEALRAGGKVMLLLNRRGFSTHIQCPGCGVVVACPDCDIPLTFHRHDTRALCHYCDHQIAAPNDCPSCGCTAIRYSGTGTQRLEAEVKARFPDIVCQRMDTDSMRKPGSHAKALEAFRDGAVRILIGTQMIAKGHDFPDVTLVGVINADTALHFPDFRAAERTFQLITQVAGRTGRGVAGGRVVVQTLSPDHVAVQAAARHDYKTFAEHEIPHREMFGYPPFGSMIRLVIRGTNLSVARLFAESISDRLRQEVAARAPRPAILGPTPASFAKLRGKHRFQILIRGTDAALMRNIVREVMRNERPPEDVQWIADVDPQDML